MSDPGAFSRLSANLRHFFTHRIARAVGFSFAADSLLFGSWVTHIPFVKSALNLNDAQLGLALFGMPLGLLLMNPASPLVLHRLGLARTTVWSTLALAVSFALPVFMPDRWSLMAALFLIGAVIAVHNVAVNSCASHLEKVARIKIMSSCHGVWSLGGMVGAGASALLIAVGVIPALHMTVLAVLVAGAMWWHLRPALEQIPEDGEESTGSRFAWPTRDLLLMILIGLTVALSEGVAFDWSAVYLRDILGASAQVAALGFAAFSMSMMAVRFTGDVLIPQFGERRLLLYSARLTVFALLTLILAPGPLTGITGFLLLGAGVSLGSPILFNAASRVPGLARGTGLATYATFSFMGFLAGPPVIGYVGEWYGFPAAFAAVAALVLGAMVAIGRVRL